MLNFQCPAFSDSIEDATNSMLIVGFEQAVKDSNQSELGRRNGGNMLSVQASERALLCYLIGRLNSLDPDVLVGHNVSAFDLDILLHRLQHHKVGHMVWQHGSFNALLLKHAVPSCAQTLMATAFL